MITIIIMIIAGVKMMMTIVSFSRFAILLSELLCLRGSRTPRRRNLDVKDRDLEIE